MRYCLVLTTVAVLSFGAPPAMAAKARGSVRDTQSQKEKQAKKACLSGDYQTGVSILADLFVESRDATYLYNQGRCYEQNVRYVEAAERFREFLRKATNLSKDDKDETERHIADCEQAVAKAKASEPTPVQAPPPPPAYVPPAYTPPPAPAVATATAASPVASEPPWQHTAKWVASGAAVGLLGLGVIEHVRYYTKNRDFNNDPKCDVAGQCKDLADAADTAQTVAIVGYAAAAVATGLAVTFWLTDSPRASSEKPAGVALLCAPTFAGAACSGRF